METGRQVVGRLTSQLSLKNRTIMSNRIKFILVFLTSAIFVLSFAKVTNAKSILQLTSTPASLFIPTPELIPVPTSTISPQSQRLSHLEVQEIDKRLEELETKRQDFNSPISEFWSALSNVLVAMFSSGWVIFAVIFLYLFQSPIRDILKVLPSRMSNVKFKFGENEITLLDVDNVVLDREILKTMLFVATIDKDPSPSELELISEQALKMNSKLDVLESDDKKKIIQAAIDLATIDKDFKNEEYGAIKAKAVHYDIPEAEMNSMIKETCQTMGIELPEVLARKAKNL